MQPAAVFISFDAVAVSGITVEATKIAKHLARHGIKSYLDVGYDIKIDKGMFNRPYGHEREIYDGIFTLVRVEDIGTVPSYNVDFIAHLHKVLISRRTAASSQEKEEILLAMAESSRHLADRLVQLWEKLNVSYVVVENGTLPENIIYTKALYLAIDTYGRRRGLGYFVVWRDHDLMWNSEKGVLKYGQEPYVHAVKPVKSAHITYVTLNNHLKERLEKWCNHEVEVKVKRNTYDFSGTRNHRNIRENLSVRAQDILIARTTRIIPQKRIDRDVYLIGALNQLFAANGLDRKVYLAIAGDPLEHPGCHQCLAALAASLHVSSLVKFVGPLRHDDMPSRTQSTTIEDLYHSCDVVSFLTSWDYDSYGNPVGEAISCQRCYITTSYEYYWEVYGQHGFEAPIMAISAEHDDLPDEAFVRDLYSFLNNKQVMRDVAERNFLIGKRVLSNHVLDLFDLNPA